MPEKGAVMVILSRRACASATAASCTLSELADSSRAFWLTKPLPCSSTARR